jgi:hypothetical protein
MADKIYNESMCAIALDVLSRGKSIARLATNIGVCRDTIYEWCKIHPEFNEAYKNGLNAAQARWEDIGEDGICGNLDKFSATAWMFTMKNRFRADYKEEKQDNKSVSDSIVEKLIDKLID